MGVLDGAVRRACKGRRGRPDDIRVAALDLGTNNCRLLIATPAGHGNLRIVDSFSRIVRLGEGVTKTGELSPEAVERTIAALKICSQHIRSHGVGRMSPTATE